MGEVVGNQVSKGNRQPPHSPDNDGPLPQDHPTIGRGKPTEDRCSGNRKDILLSAYRETTALNIHFYNKRSAYILAFVTAMTSVGVVYVSDPARYWWTIILPMAIGYICLYMDLYIHKRVIITAACLKGIEEQLSKALEDGGAPPLPMSEIIAVRKGSGFTKKTGGRYATIYGVTTFIVLGLMIVFTGLEWNEECMDHEPSIRSYFTLVALIVILSASAWYLYKTVLKATVYDAMLYDYPNAKCDAELYNIYLNTYTRLRNVPKPTHWKGSKLPRLYRQRVRLLYYTDKKFRDGLQRTLWGPLYEEYLKDEPSNGDSTGPAAGEASTHPIGDQNVDRTPRADNQKITDAESVDEGQGGPKDSDMKPMSAERKMAILKWARKTYMNGKLINDKGEFARPDDGFIKKVLDPNSDFQSIKDTLEVPKDPFPTLIALVLLVSITIVVAYFLPNLYGCPLEFP